MTKASDTKSITRQYYDMCFAWIRDGVGFRFSPLPHDLTKEEADKICAIIHAHVKEDAHG